VESFPKAKVLYILPLADGLYTAWFQASSGLYRGSTGDERHRIQRTDGLGP
jgi:hypothetical protein